jgi:2-dehydropantoate 2-reductase
MKILVLGAGSIGGYFGGRLAQAGADVTFLVRPGRKAQLERDGLVITSMYGDYQAPAKAVTKEELRGSWDFVLLTSKAYDLEAAIESIRPAVGANTAVLPLLNGIAHIERLNKEFGRERVLGGLAKIVVALSAEGTIQHLNDWRYIVFGEQDGTMSPRVKALQEAFPKESVVATAVPNILQRMWEKIVHLSTVAGVTTLMRGNVGEIASVPGGTELFKKMLAANAEISGKEGFPIGEDFLSEYRTLFENKSSPYVPSILRDLERKNRVEGDHIIGFMLERAKAHGLDSTVHQLAWMHLKTYEQRLAAGRL